MRPSERHFRPGEKRPGKDNSGKFGIAAVVGVVVLMVYLGRGDRVATSADSEPTVAPTADRTISGPTSPPSPTPAATQSLSRARVRAGITMLATMRRADGWDGALVFSRNCHAALETTFNWGGLDRCGGFDAAAAAQIDDPNITEEAAEWFQSEAAAGRYLALTTTAGLPPEEADARWSALTKFLPRQQAVPPTPIEITRPQEVDPVSDLAPIENKGQNEGDEPD